MKEKYAKLLVNLLLWAAGIVLLFTVVPRLLLFFLPLVIGWILAILANPLVRLMEKRFRIVRRHGSMLIIITAIALVVLVLYLIIARLGGEIVGFIYAFPETYARMGEEFTQIGKNLSGVYAQLPDGLQAGLASWAPSLIVHGHHCGRNRAAHRDGGGQFCQKSALLSAGCGVRHSVCLFFHCRPGADHEIFPGKCAGKRTENVSHRHGQHQKCRGRVFQSPV